MGSEDFWYNYGRIRNSLGTKSIRKDAADANIWRALGYARVTAAMMERLEGLENSKQ